MGALANLSYDDSIKQETDSVGGKFKLFDSGVELARIKLAYLQQADSGALGLNCTFQIGEDEYKETFWMTNREGKNYFIDKQSGDKKYLAGFLHADAICCLAGKKPIAEMDTETKLVKLYNSEAKQEVPTKVDVLDDLTDKEIKLGIIKQKVFKQEKVDGKYVDTDETREENTVDKVFRASDDKTTAEIRAKAEEATFINVWKERWEGQIKDRTKNGPKKAAGKAGAPKPGAAAGKATSSLFDD
ncbi:hypothetical protein K5F27_16945 [Acinetobacter baumannii]|uniref:hypothetical protein n=1 Tax=Acinetobacter baumannii TaxID=470 RepID=UPI001FF561AB|nr:hypothetical protein [Acinetobacter baumannii]MCJ9118968.1 hypothetical protein [Acinetobacter baumannii]MCJ9181403.1 hypothetical protein [Acinetobacter baumannii]MCJ9185106.1 hypothetical protein [Acinetobacter baumannii]MCJ9192345.1 hypothetical protein [Acinetobacter baumannii]MCJ9199716.1 hypothetical protein [Acinetobacter baumannii]